MQTNRRRIRRAAGVAVAVAAIASAMAQSDPTLVAYWDFNDDSDPNRTLDQVFGFEGLLEGGAVFTTGRTGGGSDNAIDFGIDTAGQVVQVNKVPFLNLAAAGDQMTISFWQNLYQIAATSAFWGVSPSSSGTMRGIQAHTPWSDSNIYFDTAGCCDAGTQRINGNVVTAVPDFATGWHHLVFVKNGSTKQIWVDGTLFLEGTNTSPLPVDFNRLVIGGDANAGNSIQGIIDDFAVYAGALNEAAIGQLASGTAPDQLPGVPVQTEPIVSGAIGNALGFTVEITDSPSLPVDETTVQVRFNGSPVTADVSKSGNVTTVAYADQANLLAPGSMHEVILDFEDTSGNAYNAVRPFTVGNYSIIPAEFALPPGSGNASQPGFVWEVHQHESLQETTVQRALDQLAGNRIDPDTGNPYVNRADPNVQGAASGTATPPNPAWAPIQFNIPTVINLSQAAGENNGNFPEDAQMPGIPGTTGSTDGIAANVLAYLEFSAPGVYTMGVNSDDGFRTYAAPRNPRDATGIPLGEFNAGRGAADTTFSFYISEAGVYPFRTVWFEGGDTANIELFTVNPDGSKVLVNDTANGGLRAFRSATGSDLYVSSVTPSSGQTGTRPDTAIEVQLMDAGGKVVDQGSIVLRLNGGTLSPNISKNGDVTTATVPFSRLLPPNSSHVASVEFGATGGPVLTGTWSFTVEDYPIVPPTLGSMPGSGVSNTRGINAVIYQVDPPANFTGTAGETTGVPQGRLMEQMIEVGEGVLAGLFGPNAAWLQDPIYPSQDGVWQVPMINFNQDAPGASIGNFQPDDPIPGIPGLGVDVVNDNIAGEFTAYIEFPAAGYYRMGVNSDDGFRTTVTETVPRQYLQVEAPASIAGPIGAMPCSRGIDGAAFGGPIPTSPIVAEAVVTDPNIACGAINNAAALAGKIALIDRGTCTFVEKCRLAQQAGALAAIIINDRPQFPFTMGGDGADVTIPVMMIMQSDGQTLKNNLNGLTLSIGSDSGLLLGQFNGGRGSADTLFGFGVPVAGVYPIRCMWYEGDGGANVEWFSVADDGTKILINDSSNPQSLRAYREWNYDPLPVPTGLIADVLETGGDNEATDTIVAQWTGQTFVNGIANEPIPGTGADDPYTVGYFGNAAPAFVDRNHRYLNDDGNALPIPAYLAGGEYIMSGNDNRDNDAYVLDVTVWQPVDVFMLIDNRTNKGDGSNTAPPNIGPGTGAMEWIDETWEPVISAGNRRLDFTQPDEVAIDEGADGTINQWYSVYRKRFPAGTFQLFQANNAGRNMYGVVVTEPQELAQPVRLSIVKNTDGTLTIEWNGDGVLETATSVTGPWTEVPGATSPYTLTPSEAVLFGRVRQ